MKFLTAVLTTHNLNACKRAVDSFKGVDTVVIVNTLNSDYYGEVKKAVDVKVIETPSAGTPGVGKQSVLDYFLNVTDYDFLFVIDGDDLIYPGGYEILRDYVIEHSPDVLGIVNEDVLIHGEHLIGWRELTSDRIVGSYKVDDEQRKKCVQFLDKIFPLIEQKNCLFNRMVGFSRKGAASEVFNPVLNGSEDVQLSAKLKLRHLQGDLEYHLLECGDIYLYCVNQSEGVSFQLYRSDMEEYTKEFFKPFSEKEVQDLKSYELPYTYIKANKGKLRRLSVAKDIVEKYKNR